MNGIDNIVLTLISPILLFVKRTLLIVLFIVFSDLSFGQKIRFTDSVNRWKVHSKDSEFSEFYHYENIIGDTVIGSIQYRILSNWVMGTALIREDTIANKVYAKNVHSPGPLFDTTEEVLFDYNLRLNDTFISHANNTIIKFAVTSFDSVLIQGISHKVWKFYYSSPPSGDFSVIEGIGCTAHPLYPVMLDNFEIARQLICFSNSFGNPLINPPTTDHYFWPINIFDNSTSCTLSTDQIAQGNKKTTISPNPIDMTSKIVLPYNVTLGKVIVVNDLGQTVINTGFQNKEELLIGDKIKVPGIYYYRATDNNSGAVFSGKFVCQ